jgi:hypothetical protein
VELDTSSSEDSDDDSNLNSIKLMSSKNAKVRLSVYSRLKKLVDSYEGKELDEVDQRILKGIFYKRNREFDEEIYNN